MYNWADYVDPDNMEVFKDEYGVDEFIYDIYANNEELHGQAPGRRDRPTTSPAPTAEYVPAMVEAGFIQKLDLSRIPNVAVHQHDVQGACGGTRKQRVPAAQGLGHDRISCGRKVVTEELKTWKRVLRGRAEVLRARSSSSTRWATSSSSRSRCSATRSTRSTRPSSMRRASCSMGSRRTSSRLDSDTYEVKLAHRGGRPRPDLDRRLVELRGRAGDRGHGYIVPEDGTLYWMDTWVILETRPHPMRRYAWLNFIHEPGDPGRGDRTNHYATPNDEAKKFVDPEILDRPAVFPPDDVVAQARRRQDTVGRQPADRHLGGVQVEHRRLSRPDPSTRPP